ncbi:MAG: DUF881 domain-containing protein [Bacillota bacterium]|jgi:uncharacterized protein YlxW (UPF0749 family)|nr:DUF881 domain-containing protein [Candidatus Fermentithermobacillaceae bacterium]
MTTVVRRGSQVALTIIFVLFGLMLATQFRVRPSSPANIHYQRAEELSLLLSATEEERDRLRDEVRMLRDQVAEAMVATESSESQVKVLQEALLKARVMAGLTEVKGPGVTIEMNDAKKEVPSGQDPNLFIIHDDDVLAVVNELLASGAEAIAINGQRVVATTEIRCAGAVIMINGVRFAPPLKIQAIGDPETLHNALKMRGGVVDNLSFWGIEVKIKMEQELVLPAYTGSLNFRFAKPFQREGS